MFPLRSRSEEKTPGSGMYSRLSNFLLIVLLKFLSFVTDIISEWQGVYCSLREVVNSILGDV